MDQNQLQKIKEKLQEAYGKRFRGLILYGSEARGEATEDSDIDLIVLLDGKASLGEDIWTNVNALIEIELASERSIHAVSAEIEDYKTGRCALYRNAKQEGFVL